MYGYRTFNNFRYRFGSHLGYFRGFPLNPGILHMIGYSLPKRNKQKGPRGYYRRGPFGEWKRRNSATETIAESYWRESKASSESGWSFSTSLSRQTCSQTVNLGDLTFVDRTEHADQIPYSLLRCLGKTPSFRRAPEDGVCAPYTLDRHPSFYCFFYHVPGSISNVACDLLTKQLPTW